MSITFPFVLRFYRQCSLEVWIGSQTTCEGVFLYKKLYGIWSSLRYLPPHAHYASQGTLGTCLPSLPSYLAQAHGGRGLPYSPLCPSPGITMQPHTALCALPIAAISLLFCDFLFKYPPPSTILQTLEDRLVHSCQCLLQANNRESYHLLGTHT